MKEGFFTNRVFIVGDEREVETNRFFRDSGELAKFTVKVYDKCDYHASLYCTGDVYRFFRNFKRVNRSKPGRSANEFHKISEYAGENCFKPIENECFLKSNNFNFKKDFSKEFLNSSNHIREEQT